MAKKTETWSPPSPPRSIATGAPAGTEPPPPTQGWASHSEEGANAPAPGPAGNAQPLGVRAPAVLVGAHLKHFRIDKRIAAGGMGEVFLGFDTSLSRPVAIKTIRGELASDPGFLARFVREATAQANVVHPHVVQVYFVGEEHGLWFLAMQIVDGGSLYDGLAQKNTMRWQDAARHMSTICEGLVVAERLGIVHRDIKPSNILLDREGRALLSDFGLAASAGVPDDVAALKEIAASGSQLQLASVTRVGVIMGTPEYVAPEQLRGVPLDARADMYALAATFFHLVSGTAVMPVPGLAEAIARYGSGQRAPRLRRVKADVPRAFASVIDRCLEVDPDRRYANMGELLDALRRASAQPEIPASPFLRAVVWTLDVAPFLAVAWATATKMPWLAPLLFLLAGACGMAALGSTPGIWMMRLRLRTTSDGDVSFARGFARFLAQHGWYVPLVVGAYALYASSDLDVLLMVGLGWFALSVLGSLGAIIGRHQTLHDLLTKTRVLVDVRSR